MWVAAAILVFNSTPASASNMLIGSDLQSFSVVAGGYATYGAGAAVQGQIGAATYIVGGAGSSSGGDYQYGGTRVDNALAQIATAQSALSLMGAGTTILPTMSGQVTLNSGIYDATALTTAANTTLILDGGGQASPFWVFNIPTYLVTGAATRIEIVNAGPNATVLWNLGGYAALGADTQFIGTILATTYISEGVGADIVCGNAYSSSYISIPAGGVSTSNDCKASGTWAGAVNGLNGRLQIADGRAVVPAVLVISEPGTGLLLLAGLGALGLVAHRRRATARV